MARTRGGGRSVTKKGLGERGHEIFTSHTYTSPNTLSSGLPTCWGGARRRRVSKRTRQEHANYTQCRRQGHGCSPRIAEQVARGSGTSVRSWLVPAPLGSAQTYKWPGHIQPSAQPYKRHGRIQPRAAARACCRPARECARLAFLGHSLAAARSPCALLPASFFVHVLVFKFE